MPISQLVFRRCRKCGKVVYTMQGDVRGGVDDLFGPLCDQCKKEEAKAFLEKFRYKS
jgi:hypothetical protein